MTENEAVERMARAMYEAEFCEPPRGMNVQRNGDVWSCRARVALMSHPAVEALRDLVRADSLLGHPTREQWDHARTVLASLPKYEDVSPASDAPTQCSVCKGSGFVKLSHDPSVVGVSPCHACDNKSSFEKLANTQGCACCTNSNEPEQPGNTQGEPCCIHVGGPCNCECHAAIGAIMHTRDERGDVERRASAQDEMCEDEWHRPFAPPSKEKTGEGSRAQEAQGDEGRRTPAADVTTGCTVDSAAPSPTLDTESTRTNRFASLHQRVIDLEAKNAKMQEAILRMIDCIRCDPTMDGSIRPMGLRSHALVIEALNFAKSALEHE